MSWTCIIQLNVAVFLSLCWTIHRDEEKTYPVGDGDGSVSITHARLRNVVFVMQFYSRACVYLYSNKNSLDLVRDMFVFEC